MKQKEATRNKYIIVPFTQKKRRMMNLINDESNFGLINIHFINLFIKFFIFNLHRMH